MIYPGTTMWVAVSFDIDNTLVERDAAVRSLLAMKLDGAEVEEAMAIDDGGRGLRALFRWLAARVPSLGDAEGVSRWFRRMVLHGVSEDASVTTTVRRIAQTHRTVVVSNGGAGQRRKLAAAGLSGAFEHVVVSGEVRARKPSPAIFERATSLLGVEPSSVLHVGDDPEADVAGAAGAGLATCWVARGRSYPPGLPKPSLVVQHVSELPEVLSC